MSSAAAPMFTVAGWPGSILTGVAQECPDAALAASSGASSATMRAMRRTLVTVAMVIACLVITASPASAHGVSGVGATNFQTRLKQVSPQVPGVTMRVVEIGSRFELRNSTDQEVVVLGYQGEPYLRVGPEGVFENQRSPATYLNASRHGTNTVPGSADPKASPEWKKVSDEPVARWHDHRIHWMGSQDPPTVRRAPDRRHVVIPEWTIPVQMGARSITATGDLVWVPAPSPLPWLVLALALLGGVAALGLTAAWGPAVAVVVALLVAADIVHAVGSASAKAGPTGAKIAEIVAGSFLSIVAWAAGAVAVWMLAHRRPQGLLAAGFAGLFIALSGGVADLVDLTRSQVPFAWGAALARLLVSASLGAGLGLVGAATLGLRRNRVPGPEPAVTGGDGP